MLLFIWMYKWIIFMCFANTFMILTLQCEWRSMPPSQKHKQTIELLSVLKLDFKI